MVVIQWSVTFYILSREFKHMLLIRKSTFSQKVTVHKKIPFISNLKMPACASKQDVLELATLWYMSPVSTSDSYMMSSHSARDSNCLSSIIASEKLVRA